MSLRKTKKHNTFEWKININVLKAKSDIFSIDGYNAQVMYNHFTYNISDEYLRDMHQFQLFLCDSWNCSVSYTFYILDREGRVFVTSKGRIQKDGQPEERILSVIDHSYLATCNLLENGILTVRFSIHRQPNAQEGSDPIKKEFPNVADYYISTSGTNISTLITKDISTNTDEGDTNLLETLSNDLSNFYINKTDTDCILKVSDAQFPVHRAVLSARSSVFSAMFHHDTAESRSGEVNILDVKATVLGDVLHYVYSGKIKGLTTNTAAPMYTVADKYDLCELRSKCFEFLKSNLTLDNFCEAALLAHTHGEMELEDRVVNFIEENLDEVLESNTWQQFLKDKTLFASKLLTSGFKVSKKKQFRDTTSK